MKKKEKNIEKFLKGYKILEKSHEKFSNKVKNYFYKSFKKQKRKNFALKIEMPLYVLEILT